MATATLVPDLTDITLAENTTGWTGATQDADNRIQGSYCNGVKVSNGRSSIYYTSGTARDFSSGGADEGDHIFIWLKCLHDAKLETKANGGICVRVGNAGGDWGEWYVDGSDTYAGGWKCYVIDPSTQFDAASGWTTSGNPAQLDDVTRFGATFETTSTVAGNTPNCFVDAIRIGTGYTIYGGTDGDEIGWDDVLAVDRNNTYQYGVIREDSGVYFLQGKITIGTSGQTTYFKDACKTLIWTENEFVGNLFYELNVDYTNTHIQLGNYDAGVISGPINVTSFDREWGLSVGTAVTEALFYGCCFFGGGLSDIYSTGSGSEFRECTWGQMGMVTLNDAVLESCKVLNSTDTYALETDLTNETDNIADCIFAGNSGYAIYVPASTGNITFDFDNLQFSGNTTADVYYADTSDDLTINVQNGGDVPTYATAGGTVTTVNAKTLILRNIVVGTRYRVENASTGAEIWSGTAAASPVQKTDYNYTADVDVKIKARYASGSSKYLPLEYGGTITTNGLDVTLQQIEDTIA